MLRCPALFLPIPLTQPERGEQRLPGPSPAQEGVGAQQGHAPLPLAQRPGHRRGTGLHLHCTVLPCCAILPMRLGNRADRGTPLTWTALVALAPHAGAATRGAASHAGGSGELERYNVPHLQFLTPPHLRKGKGGRQPAIDPRLVSRLAQPGARRVGARAAAATIASALASPHTRAAPLLYCGS